MQNRSRYVAAGIIAIYTCLVLADAWTTVTLLRIENTYEVNPFIDVSSFWTILRFQLLPWFLFVAAALWAFPKTVVGYGAKALTNDLSLRTFNSMRFTAWRFAGIPLPVWAPATVMLVVMIATWSRLFTVVNNTCIIFGHFALFPLARYGQIIAAESGLSTEYSTFLALIFFKLVIVFPPMLVLSLFLLVQLVKFAARGMDEVSPPGISAAP